MATTLTAATKFTAVDKFTAVVSKMAAATRGFAATAQSSFARAQRSVQSVINSSNNLFNRLISLRSAAGVMFAGMAVKKVWDMASGIAEVGDEAAKTSRMIGITAESLQALRFAADRQGVSSEMLTKGLVLLNRNIGDVQLGQGTLTTVLKRSNPALLEQLKNVSSNEEAFALMSKAVSEAPNQLQKTALAQAAFGRSGTELLKFLEAGPDGIKALTDEAHRLGIVMSEEMTKKSEKFVDVQTNMQAALKGMQMTIGVGLMPKIQAISERITEWSVANRDLVKIKAAEWIEKISKVARFLKDNISTIILVLKIYVGLLISLKVISTLAAAATIALKVAQVGFNIVMGISNAIMGKSAFLVHGNTVAYGAFRAAVIVATIAQKAFNFVMSMNPIGLMIIGIAALIALVVVVVKKWNDWGAAVSLFLGPLGIVISMIQSFRRNWDMIKKSFADGGILEGFKAIGRVILDSILQPVQQLLELIAKIPGMASSMQPAIDKIQSYREGLGVNTTTDESGNPLQSAPSQTQNQKIEIGVTADPGTSARERKNTGSSVIITNTVGFKPLAAQW